MGEQDRALLPQVLRVGRDPRRSHSLRGRIASGAGHADLRDRRGRCAGRAGSAQPPFDTCAPGRRDITREATGDDDLYCIELLPAVDIERAAGTARLVPPSSPFGIAVTPAGEPQYDVVFTLRDLPSPSVARARTPRSSRGRRRRSCVRWSSSARFATARTRLGRVAFDRFLILITAERIAAGHRAARPLVLRGTSASVRMQPHDLAFLLAGLIDTEGALRPITTRTPGMRRAAARARRHGRRRRCIPEVSMPPAFMSLRPDVSSYLPRHATPRFRWRGRASCCARRRRTLDARRPRRSAACSSAARSRCSASTASIPGPLIQVRRRRRRSSCASSTAPTFRPPMHWHGLRLDNRFDGVPHVTQEPVAPGRRVRLPRALSATPASTGITRIIARTCCRTSGSTATCSCGRASPGIFAPANREEVLMLDDLLVAESGPGRLRPRVADARADGPIRQRAARQRRAALGNAASAAARWCGSFSPTSRARASSTCRSRATRADESGGVRPRPLRARSVGRQRHHRAGRALRRRRALSDAPATSRSSIACAPSTTSWRVLRRDARARRRARRRATPARPIIARASSACARTPRCRGDRPLSAAFRASCRSRARCHAAGRRPAVSAAPAAQPRIGLSQSGRVERDDAGDGLDRDRPERAVAAARHAATAREHGHRLAVPRRRRRQAAAGQRSHARCMRCSTRSTFTGSASSSCR